MTHKLLVATHNPGKVREYRELLAGLPLEVTYLDAEGIMLEVEETGVTFAENAILKATTYARASGLLTWADDSGLEVDALGGAPGVYSSRYAGPDASDADRYRKLLDALTGVPWDRRTARFRCTVALAAPCDVPGASGRPGLEALAGLIVNGRNRLKPRIQNGEPLFAGQAACVSAWAERLPSEAPGTWSSEIRTADGVCEGIIAFGPAGENGFGYDPVFYMSEHAATLAQLPAEVKNRISHRGRAAQAAARMLGAMR